VGNGWGGGGFNKVLWLGKKKKRGAKTRKKVGNTPTKKLDG